MQQPISLVTQIGIVAVATAMSYRVDANTLHVCSTCAHTSIQSAVNEAASGDTINIAAGVYIENVTIEDKALTLIGAAGGTSGVTQVSATGRGPVFTLGSAVLHAPYHLITLQNLTISRGSHFSGTEFGGGIQVRIGAYLHLSNSIVMQNAASVGAGISFENGSGAGPTPESTITNCLIDDNVATRGAGGIDLGSGTLLIQNSTISRNQSIEGGGISTGFDSQLIVKNTVISQNVVAPIEARNGLIGGDGGGLAVSGDFDISGSTITGNVSKGPPGGGGMIAVLSDGGTHRISTSTITGNSTAGPRLGAGIMAEVPSSSQTPRQLLLDNDFIIENLQGGGIQQNDSETMYVLTNTVVEDNEGGDICDITCP